MSPSLPFCFALPVAFETKNPTADDYAFGSAVPLERRPQPLGKEVLRHCGPNAALVEARYEGQKSPWGVVSYNAHSVAFVVTARGPDDVLQVYLVRQWRVTDADSWEVPAGGASSLQDALREEFVPEVGVALDDIESVRVFRPFSGEVCRAVHENGGPKSVHVVHVYLRDGVPLNGHQYSDGQDEHVQGFWIALSDLERCMEEGRVVDVVTIMALARCLYS